MANMVVNEFKINGICTKPIKIMFFDWVIIMMMMGTESDDENALLMKMRTQLEMRCCVNMFMKSNQSNVVSVF